MRTYVHYAPSGVPDIVCGTLKEFADALGVTSATAIRWIKYCRHDCDVVNDDDEVDKYLDKHADWVKVVRCKDCVFSVVDEFYAYWCQNKNARQGKTVPARWFCAEGRFTAEDD